MEDNVTILFSFCGVDPTIEKDEEKYKYIRNLYSDSKIITTDRSKLNADCRKIIQGADTLVSG